MNALQRDHGLIAFITVGYYVLTNTFPHSRKVGLLQGNQLKSTLRVENTVHKFAFSGLFGLRKNPVISGTLNGTIWLQIYLQSIYSSNRSNTTRLCGHNKMSHGYIYYIEWLLPCPRQFAINSILCCPIPIEFEQLTASRLAFPKLTYKRTIRLGNPIVGTSVHPYCSDQQVMAHQSNPLVPAQQNSMP